jgi:hypothetical protein
MANDEHVALQAWLPGTHGVPLKVRPAASRSADDAISDFLTMANENVS